MAEIQPLVVEVLIEAGFPPIDVERAPWEVARDVAQDIAEGTLPISKGADFLIGELRDKCDPPQEIYWLMLLIDDWASMRDSPPSDYPRNSPEGDDGGRRRNGTTVNCRKGRGRGVFCEVQR